MMKKLIYICLIFFLSGCIFTYDPPRGSMEVTNNSDKTVYVFDNYSDSLPLIEELYFFKIIKPAEKKEFFVWGSPKKPQLPDGVEHLTLFFISEETILNNDLYNIYKKQMYKTKVQFTQEQMDAMNWEYNYNP